MLKIKRILSKKGFSLVELMVAVAILGAAAMGIFQSYKVGFWGMSDARARTIATNIAQEKLEEVKGKSLADGTFPDPDNPIVVSGKEFNATIIIDKVESTLKKITTKVSWQKRNGEPTEISIESLLNMPPVFPADDVATSILVNTSRTSISLIGEDKTSTITVMILDQDNYPISFNGQVDLSLKPPTPVLGTLTDDSLTFSGQSYLSTTFTATNAGKVYVKGESTGLISDDSDTITITGGPPVKINLVADPSSILIGGEISTLTIRIEDENDKLADSWTGTVTLSILSGSTTSGTLASTTLYFDEENIKTTKFTSSGTPGTVEIKAEDTTTGGPGYTPLASGEETIYVSSGPPTQIDIEANPKNIFIEGYTGGGSTSCDITVTIKNATDIQTGWTGTVTLSILSGEDSGTLNPPVELSFTGESILSTTFTSSGTPGSVEIKAEDTTGGPGYTPLTSDTEIITVAAGPPTKIKLNAIPNIILNNGEDNAAITIITEDSWGNRSGFEGNTTITLSADQPSGNIGGAGNSEDIILFEAGESLKITTFTCDNTYEGVITITASGGGLSGDSVTITVAPVIIRPAENPNIQYGYHYFWWWKVIDENIIYFNIEVLGGDVEINEIDVSWTPNNNERLTGLRISNSDGDIRINGTWSGRPSVVKILKDDDFSTYNDLVVGIYTVRLLFNTDIMQKSISIKFFTNFQDYQLEFLSPDQIV